MLLHSSWLFIIETFCFRFGPCITVHQLLVCLMAITLYASTISDFLLADLKDNAFAFTHPSPPAYSQILVRNARNAQISFDNPEGWAQTSEGFSWFKLETDRRLRVFRSSLYWSRAERSGEYKIFSEDWWRIITEANGMLGLWYVVCHQSKWGIGTCNVIPWNLCLSCSPLRSSSNIVSMPGTVGWKKKQPKFPLKVITEDETRV